MDDYTTEEVREALRPIASLLSKSEKAQQKLTPGTWQHTMLRDNVKALRIALTLMGEASGNPEESTSDDLKEALQALGSMIERVENAQSKFSPGTSQHSLQRNRLKALRIAQAAVNSELDQH
ncbi:MAG: hypothetical protein AB2L09_08385 [Coriobacteriia bacterium]